MLDEILIDKLVSDSTEFGIIHFVTDEWLEEYLNKPIELLLLERFIFPSENGQSLE